MTRTYLRRMGLGACALMMALSGGGCLALAVGAAAGAGTVAYVKGELQVVEDIPLDRAWTAAQATIEELQFNKTAERKDALQGRITAERADGSNVTIRLDSRNETQTRIRIRVGTFGDEAVSRTILDGIKRRA